MKIIEIEEEYIRLCDLLKFAGAAETGGQAKLIITSGRVKLNGEPCLLRGKKIRPGDAAEYDGKEYGVRRK